MASKDNTSENYLRSEISKTKARIAILKEKRRKIPAMTVSIPQLSSEGEVNADILLLKSKRLKEEIKLLKQQKVEGLPNKADIRRALAKKALIENNKNMKMVLQLIEAKFEELLKKKERLNENVVLSKELQEALKNSLTQLQEQEAESEDEKQHKFEVELYGQYQEMKKTCEYYTDKMLRFITENYPTPDRKRVTQYYKQCLDSVKTEDSRVMSLAELIQKLVNQHLSNPNESYIAVDETVWPPYVGLLLNCDIISRHPDNHYLICLENFLE